MITSETSKIQEYNDIADTLLKAAGYSLEDDNSVKCSFKDICQKVYDTSNCDSTKCRMLKDLKFDTLDVNILEELKRRLKIKNTTEMKGIEIACPRALQTHAKIHKLCNNSTCHFFSKRMAFHCMLLHCSVFFPEEDIPNRVIEVSTGMSSNILDRYKQLSIFYIRMYLILFKYCLENLKLDYNLTFQTKYVFELLQAQKYSDQSSIDCCPNCGAVAKVKVVSKKIGNTEKYVNSIKVECLCNSSKEIRDKRLRYADKWKQLLMKSKKVGFNDYSYIELLSIHRHDFFSKQFVRSMLSEINISNVHLYDIPIGYILKSYIQLFGKIDSNNFGLTTSTVNKLTRLFTS